MSLISIQNVSKEYLVGDQTVRALDDVTLDIERGVFLAIAGPSGSGKSTLLNIIGCIDTPSSGRLTIDGEDTSGKSPDELADLRSRTIGFVFQTFNLFPVLTAEENVEYPLLQFREIDRAERRARVQHFLRLVGLADHAHRRPNELSGGQRQRVAIARALATHPKIILADEPTANLDSRTGSSIIRLMKHINRRYETTFVFSTHDKKVIAKADRLVRIADGKLRILGVRTAANWVVVRARPGAAPN